MSPETWRPVVGYEGYYEVSNLGRVRSLDRVDRSGKKRRGRVLRAQPHRDGHLRIRLSRADGGRSFDVHRLVGEAFIGPLPSGMETRHLDGDPSNNASTNLAYGTKAENNDDRVRHGTHHNARKTHCPRNHPLVEPNLVAAAARRGGRTCLACSRERGRARKTGAEFSIERADASLQQIMSEHQELAA